MLVIVPLGLRLTWSQNERVERRDAGIQQVLRVRRLDRALDVDVVVVGLDQQALEAAAERESAR